MPSTASLLANLTVDFPQLRFVIGNDFRWSATEQTIYYPAETDRQDELLHEVAHGVLKHHTFSKDVRLLEMERAAWEYARTELAPRYGVTVGDDTIESALDTYRDWLHARSTCPQCHATGIEIKKYHYRCLACQKQWRVNDARLCGLKRYGIA